MIDIVNGLRRIAEEGYRFAGDAADEIERLRASLKAAEKERDALRSLVVMRFDHDHPPQFTQGYDTHELTEPVTAEHCRWFVAEIERLSAEVAHIKEVEFPRKAQAVADGWRGKCERLEAKIEAMERQEPVAWQTRTRPAWNDGTWGPWRKCSKEYAEDIKKTPSLHDWLYEARALYALQGAKGEEK